MSNWMVTYKEDDMLHYGVKGMKWRFKKGPKSKQSNAGINKGLTIGITAAKKAESTKPTSYASNVIKKLGGGVHSAEKDLHGDYWVTGISGKRIILRPSEFKKLPIEYQRKITKKVRDNNRAGKIQIRGLNHEHTSTQVTGTNEGVSAANKVRGSRTYYTTIKENKYK